MMRKGLSSRVLTERASNDPQRMRARKTEAKIMEMMPIRVWLSCTAVARLIGIPDDRKTRARLDRLAHDGKIVADIFCAAIILVFAVAFFGMLGGSLAFIILEGALLAVDYVVPHQDDVSGAVIR